jgi:antitoxin (DNA-binding transcriptional repressor) of toxin-antitoxin stability system
MSAKTEITMSATEFKAKCLNLMDRIASGSLSRVRVTKRGKVTAELVGAAGAKKGPVPFHGFLRDRITVNPDFDWAMHSNEAETFDATGVELSRRVVRRVKAGTGK